MKLKKLVKKVTKALAGFSLVEMLVVIAVIGVITAIAVPAISSITSEAENAKDSRNAQNIVSVYNSAVAAGASISTNDESAALTSLINGVTGGGTFSGATFVCDIPATETAAALGKLSLANGIMTLD